MQIYKCAILSGERYMFDAKCREIHSLQSGVSHEAAVVGRATGLACHQACDELVSWPDLRYTGYRTTPSPIKSGTCYRLLIELKSETSDAKEVKPQH